MSFTFRYDRSCHPTAPVLPLRVSRPGAESGLLLRALIDTGADCTLIPAYLVERLRLPAVDGVAIEGRTLSIGHFTTAGPPHFEFDGLAVANRGRNNLCVIQAR